jgi:hypothetical protein
MLKYHKDIGFKNNHVRELYSLINVLNKSKRIFSLHSLRELSQENNADIIGKSIFNYILNPNDVFELAIENDKLSKIGFRINYNNEYDIIFILSIKNVIITAWLNKKDDTHLTLNKKHYNKI